MRKRLKLLGLFGILSLGLSSCGSGPKVTVCIVAGLADPPHLVCVDPKDQVTILSLPQAENYVAFSPSDARSLIESCGIKGAKRAAVLNRFARIQELAD